MWRSWQLHSSLQHNNIGDAGAAELAAAFKVNTCITTVDLWDNNIGDTGAAELADAFKLNELITHIYLHQNCIGDAGAAELAVAFKVNTSITEVNLWNNYIGDAGAAELAAAFKVNKSITEVDLESNSIGDAGAAELAAAFKVNTSITHVCLNNNSIRNEMMKTIQSAVKHEPTAAEQAFEVMQPVMERCVPERGDEICPLCKNGFNVTVRTPLILPCLHSICKECVSDSELTCYDCKKPTPTANIQVDYITIGRLRGGAALTPMCQFCEEETATKFCGDCDSNNILCDDCSTFAHKKGAKRGHTPTPISEHLGGGGASKPLKCHEHPTLDLELFCHTCERLICVKCGSFGHREHDFVSIEQELEASKEMIVSAAVPTVNAFTTIEEAVTHCNQMVTELDQHEKDGVESIDGMFTVVRQTWVQRKETLKGEFTAEVARKRALVNDCIGVLEAHHGHTQLGLGMVKEALDKATPTQLLGMRKVLVSGLQGLERHGLAMEPECNSTVRVDPTADYDVMIGLLATLGSVVGE